jgi:predicted O-methyltransferase YrrM
MNIQAAIAEAIRTSRDGEGHGSRDVLADELDDVLVDVLADVRRRADADGIPTIDPLVAHVLRSLTEATGARRVLDIGTGYGGSAIALAGAMPDEGVLFTFEVNPSRAAVAREHIAAAGLTARAHIMIGDASRLVHKVAGPFDAVLQDSDPMRYDGMLDRLVGLLRPGGILVSHGVARPSNAPDGPGIPAPHHDPATQDALAGYNRRLAGDARLATDWFDIGRGVAVSVRRDTTTP